MLLREGRMDLGPFASEINDQNSYSTVQVKGRVFSAYPLFPVLLALPVISLYEYWPAAAHYLIPYMPSADGPWEQDRRVRLSLEKTIGSLLMALSSVAVFFIACVYLSPFGAGITALIFSFAGPTWSVLSRAAWPQDAAVLLMCFGLLALLHSEKSRLVSALSGFFFALAYLSRPTAALAWMFTFIYLFSKDRTALLRYFLASIPVFVGFAIWNTALFGEFLPPYYRSDLLGGIYDFPIALAGNLISPSRGLLVYCSWCIPVLVWTAWAWRKGRLNGIEKLSACLGPALLVSVSISGKWWSSSCWWGGHTFGPRIMSDWLPFLMVLTAAYLKHTGEIKNTGRMKAYSVQSVIFASLVCLSVWIHAQGALRPQTLRWNTRPVSIDTDPSRLWDLSDLQFLR